MSAIGSGQLKHRVRIQQPATVKDALGAPTQSWVDVANVWADIQPISGREARIADRLSSRVSHQIMVRYRTDFDDPQRVAQMRVLYRTRVFAVHAALNDDEGNVAVILLATEGSGNG